MKKTKEEAAITKEQILDAAKELFLTHGYERTTLLDICNKAQLSRGALYWHFKDKEQLYSEVLHNVIDELHDQKTQIINDSSMPIVEKLVSTLELPIKNVDSYRLVNNTIIIAKSNPELEPLIDEVLAARETCKEQIRGMLNDYQSTNPFFEENRVEAMTATIYYLFEGFYFDYAENSHIDRQTIQMIVNNLFRRQRKLPTPEDAGSYVF